MKNRILYIYGLLLDKYGRQRWWPTTLRGDIKPAYHGKKPDKRQKFEICVGAILTQNTSWKNVEKAIINLNKEKILSIDGLAGSGKKRIAGLIKPSGYFNQKAERLKLIAGFFSKENIGDFHLRDTGKARESLLDIKGIGPETADSILLYAFDKPIFVIDAYTRRIFSRAGLCSGESGYHCLQEMFQKSLPEKTEIYNEYHALIVELAKQHCMKKPSCKDCPLAGFCVKK